MVLRDLGKLLLAVSTITFVCVFVWLAWLIWPAKSASESTQVGFYLPGVWSMWGGWILLWLLITGTGLALLTVKRS